MVIVASWCLAIAGTVVVHAACGPCSSTRPLLMQKFVVVVVVNAEVGDQRPPIILVSHTVSYYAVSTASAVPCAW
jgi:hypothetical protein